VVVNKEVAKGCEEGQNVAVTFPDINHGKITNFGIVRVLRLEVFQKGTPCTLLCLFCASGLKAEGWVASRWRVGRGGHIQ